MVFKAGVIEKLFMFNFYICSSPQIITVQNSVFTDLDLKQILSVKYYKHIVKGMHHEHIKYTFMGAQENCLQ